MPPWIPPLTDGSPTIDTRNGHREHSFTSTANAALELKAGRPVIVIGGDDGDRSGQLVFAAQLATPATVAFAVRYSSGILCTPMTTADCDRLDLPAMQGQGREVGPNFTVSVDALAVESTGISATDRALTIGTLAGHDTAADDFTRPGHVFPVRTVDGGVLVNPTHGEAACDLTRIAQLRPIGASATLVNDDGSISRPARLKRFANQHGLPVVTIEDLVAYRLGHETHVVHHSTATVRREQGEFTVTTYASTISNHQIAAIIHGDIVRRRPLVRYHRECTHGCLFGAPLCSCADRLDAHLRAIASAESGVLVFSTRTGAAQPALIERLTAPTTLGSPDQENGDITALDRLLPALGDQVLLELGVDVPVRQLLGTMTNPSSSLTWVPSRSRR